ncbi:hypothetical protein F5141DRAFT_1066675 [Pisolithus sp. B1]|nr:hypothetical protein F5141DRAFT_1066675 [Pisolithus sp. B1]
MLRSTLGTVWRLAEFLSDRIQKDMEVCHGFIDPILKVAFEMKRSIKESEQSTGQHNYGGIVFYRNTGALPAILDREKSHRHSTGLVNASATGGVSARRVMLGWTYTVQYMDLPSKRLSSRCKSFETPLNSPPSTS